MTDSPSSSWKKILAGVVVGLAVLVMLIRVFVFQLANVPDNNMQPTLAASQTTLVNMLAMPEVGDVALIEASGTLMMRRIVAKGGQTVALEDGLLVVDGKAVETTKGDLLKYGDLPGPDRGVAEKSCLIYEETTADATYRVCIGQGNRVRGAATKPVQVPADRYYVLCDNRLYCGVDSREFGFVEKGAILGRVDYLISQDGAGGQPADGPLGLWHEIR